MLRQACVIFAAALALAPVSAALAAEHVGRLLNYVRSNVDGSAPEAIHVFRASPALVKVNKAVSRCTNSAFVTADLDLERGEARSLVGGRLTRALTQDAFGWLSFERDGSRVEARLNVDGHEVTSSAEAPDRPRVLFDFDLADLSARTERLPDPKAGFSFGLPLVWPGDDPGRLFRYLGRADARFEREEVHAGRAALRFSVTGPAFKSPGILWLDASDGFVVGAEWPMPNHAEYTDFKLELTSVDDGGEAAWRAVLADHWKGCPQP